MSAAVVVALTVIAPDSEAKAQGLPPTRARRGTPSRSPSANRSDGLPQPVARAHPQGRAPSTLSRAAPLRRLQGRVLPAGVGRVEVRPGRHDLVDAVEQRRRQRHVGGAELGLELLHRARPDDRRGDRRDGGSRTRAPCRSASCRPRRRAAPSASAASSLRWLAGIEQVVALGQPLRARELSGGSSPLRQLARQPAAGERAPGDDAHAVALAGRAARRPRCRARASSTAAARRRSARGRGARPPTAPRRSATAGKVEVPM